MNVLACFQSLPVYGALTVVFIFVSVQSAAQGQGWDEDDLIVTGIFSNNIAVFDADLTFKGYLDSNFPGAWGLDFNSSGQVVAVGQSSIRVYNSDGSLVSSFHIPQISDSRDVAVGANGNFFIASSFHRINEVSQDGVLLNAITIGPYYGVAAITNSGILAGGYIGNEVRVFDAFSGNLIDTIALDTDEVATSLLYDRSTNTVFVCDANNNTVFQRNPDGTLVQTFTDEHLETPWGATIGPNGDVFGTEGTTSKIYKWDIDGNLISVTSVLSVITVPGNVLWAGNAPNFMVATLSSAQVTFGSLVSGGVPDLQESDDVILHAKSQFGFLSSEPNTLDLRVQASTSIQSPNCIKGRIEARLNNPGGIVSVRMHDWSTNQLAEVHTYALGTTEDNELYNVSNAAVFVRESDGLIECSIKPVVIATFSLSGFDAFFDLVSFEIEP